MISYGTVFVILSGCCGSEQYLGYTLLYKCLNTHKYWLHMIIETEYLIYVFRITSCNQKNFIIELR